MQILQWLSTILPPIANHFHAPFHFYRMRFTRFALHRVHATHTYTIHGDIYEHFTVLPSFCDETDFYPLLCHHRSSSPYSVFYSTISFQYISDYWDILLIARESKFIKRIQKWILIYWIDDVANLSIHSNRTYNIFSPLKIELWNWTKKLQCKQIL